MYETIGKILIGFMEEIWVFQEGQQTLEATIFRKSETDITHSCPSVIRTYVKEEIQITKILQNIPPKNTQLPWTMSSSKTILGLIL